MKAISNLIMKKHLQLSKRKQQTKYLQNLLGDYKVQKSSKTKFLANQTKNLVKHSMLIWWDLLLQGRCKKIKLSLKLKYNLKQVQVLIF